MNLLLWVATVLASGLISLVLVWAILSPRVRDGIVIKAGLICMAMGFGAVAAINLTDHQSAHALARAQALISSGIAVVILGYLLRRVREGHPVRRETDWADLDEAAAMPAEKGGR